MRGILPSTSHVTLLRRKLTPEQGWGLQIAKLGYLAQLLLAVRTRSHP